MSLFNAGRSKRVAQDPRDDKLTAWAVRNRLWACLGAGLLSALAAWWISHKYDGATTGELVFWGLVMVPMGVIGTWISLTRLGGRGSS